MKKILLGLVILSMFAGNAFAADLAVTITKRQHEGASRVTYGYITAAITPYTTGGISVTPRMLGLDNVTNITFSSISSATYSYVYDYSNETLILYYTRLGIGKPAVVPVAADVFIVNDDNAAASNGKLVCVSAYGGASGGILSYLDDMGGGAALLTASVIAASDSTTTLALADSNGCLVGLRTGVCGGDTVFFDDNATLTYEALFYSGSGLGDMGTIYIPYGNGNFIQVLKKTNSQILQANALPLYFVEASHIANKFESVTNGNADGTFSVSQSYTSLPYFHPILGTEILDGVTVSVKVYFMAVGN